jgi:hypothetical protein
MIEVALPGASEAAAASGNVAAKVWIEFLK